MSDNTLPDGAASLGGFLRDRRDRLQPGAGAPGRRRTPGLRREEVAARAGVSVTWYTWLEQGRGGPPSDAVLERLCGALELDAGGRELLFLLARQRPPPQQRKPLPAVPPALQKVLDGMPTSPAIVKSPTWDIVAWNAPAMAVLGADAAELEPNLLRRLFGNAALRTRLPDWEDNARLAIGVFRIDVARAGGSSEAAALAEELSATSPDFRRLWAENGARSHGFGTKRIHHPVVGALSLEFASFPVDGADGLTMLVFTPATAADARAIEALVRRQDRAA